ncbi:hypothetical protein GCM10009839_36010 [Catenulispora yoronensis]|uniref:Uncharacterized protein n=1 Tax=Catenulispora yoronensis TaxID=450799 RepID=A0ABN2UA32_9ACTN
METMTTVVFGTQANYCPAPLFRVVGGAVVPSYRPVSGQECSGFGDVVLPVVSVSGVLVTGAAQALSLRGIAGAVAGAPGAVLTAERPVRPGLAARGLAARGLAEQRAALLAQVDGDEHGTTSFTDSSSDQNNGSKPMTPWGYRSSSPPG